MPPCGRRRDASPPVEFRHVVRIELNRIVLRVSFRLEPEISRIPKVPDPILRVTNAALHWGEKEAARARVLIDLALEEDLGEAGDLTSHATIPAHERGQAALVARVPGVLCGMPIVAMLCDRFQLMLRGDAHGDGTRLTTGEAIGVVSGLMRDLLACERTALNFLQRLSGVATLSARFVEAVRGTGAAILDTRKTTPGWRVLEKYAVRCGGAANHRVGLFDAVLIKDNHLAHLERVQDPAGVAIAAARAQTPPGTLVEIEVTDLSMFERALACKPDIILLDNMSLDQLAQAVHLRNKHEPRVLLEASGGVRLETVGAIARTGVDRISVGALTHSAPSLDIALDYIPSPTKTP